MTWREKKDGQYTTIVNCRGSMMLHCALLESLDPDVSFHFSPTLPIKACCCPYHIHYVLPSLAQWLLLGSHPQFRCHLFRGPSLSSCRHRIKAWKITLLCPYGVSIGLGQRTLNCNSAIVEKKKVSWAHQSAHLDKLLVVVIFQM